MSDCSISVVLALSLTESSLFACTKWAGCAEHGVVAFLVQDLFSWQFSHVAQFQLKPWFGLGVSTSFHLSSIYPHGEG